jgi:hypothetical protein
MKYIKWKYPEFLRENKIEPKHIRREARGLGPNVSYDWQRTERPPAKLDIRTLESMLEALERILKRPVALTELLDWEDSPSQ